MLRAILRVRRPTASDLPSSVKMQRPGRHARAFDENLNAFSEALFVFFGLLFRRRQALKTLQEFFFRHTLDGNIRVIGVNARTG